MNILEARRRTLGKGVYKKTVEGNPAIAQGSLARRYPGITMQGWTEQAQYEGKNLFNILDFESNNKGIIENETILFNQSLGIVRYYLNLNPGTYSISIKRSGYSGIGIRINEVLVINNGGSANYTGNFDVSDGDSVVLDFSEGQNPNGEDRMVYDIMLNSGSTAIPYEPYTGRQPSPNPDYPQEIVNAGKYDEESQKWKYEVKLTGKNLWDKVKAADKSKWVPSTSQSGYSDFAINVAPDQKITVSFPEKLPTGLGYYVGIVLEENGPVAQWMYHSTIEMLIHQQATVTSIVDKIWIRCVTSVISNFVLENQLFQVEYGSQRTEYAPYQDQAVTLTADRPLTKWDKLEKRAGVWGWVYKSAEVVLDGSEDEDWMFQADANRKIQFYITLSDALYPYSDPFDKMFYCNTFFTTNALGAIPNWQVRKGTYNELAPVFKPGDNIDSVDLFRAFLAENPTTILYATEEETFVPLSETEQEQMNALRTYYPTTMLSNDAGCEMTLTYKTKKSLEVTT